ncbi:MAG: methylated-DNA--[protein]-cysteine S-methyltransferase [Chloroflexales bacterium]|nr:methylated-DNA--[protein]-cysteine S-methyltransferase [Chloroflexales bacterium]
MTRLLIDRIVSPLGEIILVVDDGQLCALDYADYEPRMQKLLRQRYAGVELAPASDPGGYSTRVGAYLTGDFTSLDAIPVKTGGTPFQQHVWQALRTIPPGAVCTYGQLAAQLGRPSAARAVGLANSLNPVAIVLPCHRVVGANGSLTGYAGGLARKHWLLAHEGIDLAAHCSRRATAP